MSNELESQIDEVIEALKFAYGYLDNPIFNGIVDAVRATILFTCLTHDMHPYEVACQVFFADE